MAHQSLKRNSSCVVTGYLKRSKSRGSARSHSDTEIPTIGIAPRSTSGKQQCQDQPTCELSSQLPQWQMRDQDLDDEEPEPFIKIEQVETQAARSPDVNTSLPACQVIDAAGQRPSPNTGDVMLQMPGASSGVENGITCSVFTATITRNKRSLREVDDNQFLGEQGRLVTKKVRIGATGNGEGCRGYTETGNGHLQKLLAKGRQFDGLGMRAAERGSPGSGE